MEAKANLDGKMKFEVTMLFPKSNVVAQLKAAKHPAAPWMADDNCQGFYNEIIKIARANFGPDVSLSSLKITKFRDGDLPKPNGKTEESDKGHIIVRTSSNEKPKCLRQDKTVITEASEVYAGCWVRAILTVAPFLKPQHGVTIYLAGIQKLADDAPFSSRPRVEDEFDAVAVEGQDATGAGEVTKMPWEQ